MKISLKIFLGISLIFAVGGFLGLRHLEREVTPRYREAVEEPLVDLANILAEAAGKAESPAHFAKQLSEGVSARRLTAPIFGIIKESIDLRFAVTDAEGRVLFDSYNGERVGQDYSKWRDIARTLNGEYGARSTRDDPQNPATTVLYVSAPILRNGELIGVAEVGKPTTNFNRFIERTNFQLYRGVFIVCALGLLMVFVLSVSLVSNPLQKLSRYAHAIGRGEPALLPSLPGDEIGELGNSFEQMRRTLEGRQYIENYVQALTHELKSPLTGIQVALEVLEDASDSETRERFQSNIRGDTKRMQMIVERMLALCALEARNSLVEREVVSLSELLQRVTEEMTEQAQGLGIEVISEIGLNITVHGDRFLLEQAIRNLVENALTFAALTVHISLVQKGIVATVAIQDDGPGIPEYALTRIFERFYSLPRPRTGKKSSGLGLCFVQEVVRLHQGEIVVRNLQPRGAISVLHI